MPAKELHFRADARETLLRGAASVADAVRVTLGPKSKCVLIDKKFGHPLVCNDGVTIARELELKEPVENLGMRVLREAAEKTGDAVGDGTTTSTLLAFAIFSDGIRNIAAGASAIDIKRGLERGLRAAVKSIHDLSRPVTGYQDRMQVATVSAHNDESIGKLVADALEKVGQEGVITVEEAKTIETVLDVVDGMQFDRGFISPYFITDSANMKAVIENCLILLYEKKIGNMKELLPLLEDVVRQGQPLLVIAEDIEAEALATLVVNKLRGTLSCLAVKAPGFGDRRKAMMEDIAILTGGRLIAEELGIKLESLNTADLGRAVRVVSDKDTTTIVAGNGRKEAIAGRCAEIRKQIEESTSDYDKEKLRERLARLSGGVAVIRAGAPSETEMKNRKEAFEDAISAAKAAAEEGIVPGGGVALLAATDAVEQEEKACEGDERTGVRILKRALEAPARQIAENSGVDGGVVVDRIRSGMAGKDNNKPALGFDAALNRYTDLVAAGIIDPTKVVRVAIENAVSVASTLLLTEATMTDIPEKHAPAPLPAGAELD